MQRKNSQNSDTNRSKSMSQWHEEGMTKQESLIYTKFPKKIPLCCAPKTPEDPSTLPLSFLVRRHVNSFLRATFSAFNAEQCAVWGGAGWGLSACFVVIKKYRTVCCSVKTNKGWQACLLVQQPPVAVEAPPIPLVHLRVPLCV